MVTQRRRLRRKQPIVSNPFTITQSETTTFYPLTPTMASVALLPTITLTPSPSPPSPLAQTPSSSLTPATEFTPSPGLTPSQNIIASVGLGVSTTSTTQQIQTKYHDGACSHLTVTRLYTNEHVCFVCMQYGAFGWLYRCCQDRDLLIEWHLGNGIEVERADDLYKTLNMKGMIRKGSPASRTNVLSLLDEMSDRQLKSYTPAQLSTLLRQRAHVQRIITTQLTTSSPSTTSPPSPQPTLTSLQILDPSSLSLPTSPNLSLQSSPNLSSLPSQPPAKPKYLPQTECQFKVCPRCRPSCRDKSFLSSNAIANGDIPATAAVGFGFHLMRNGEDDRLGGRPVVPVSVYNKSPVPEEGEDEVGCAGEGWDNQEMMDVDVVHSTAGERQMDEQSLSQAGNIESSIDVRVQARKLRRRDGSRDIRRETSDDSTNSSSSQDDKQGGIEMQETKRPSPLRIFNTHSIARVDPAIISINGIPQHRSQYTTTEEGDENDSDEENAFSWDVVDDDDAMGEGIEAERNAVTMNIPSIFGPNSQHSFHTANQGYLHTTNHNWSVQDLNEGGEPNERDALEALEHLTPRKRSQDESMGEGSGEGPRSVEGHGGEGVGGFDAEPVDVKDGIAVMEESAENGATDVFVKSA